MSRIWYLKNLQISTMRFASFLFFDDSLIPFTYSITINMYNHLNIKDMNKTSLAFSCLPKGLQEHHSGD